MKKINLARMTLLLVIPAYILVILGSCQKDEIANRPNDGSTNQAANLSANSLPHTKQYPSDVATAWFNLLTQMARTKPYPNPQSLRIYAYSGVALYESVVPGMPSYQSIYTYLTGNRIDVDKKKDYFWPACANAAIARIASKTMQHYPSPNLAPLQELESSLNKSFESRISSQQLSQSIEFGRQVGDVIYEWSKTDGTLNGDGTLAACPPYIPLGGPGNWVPTPPGFFPAAGACQGSLRTFVPNIVNILAPAAPPAYSEQIGSPFFMAADEVYNASLQLSDEDHRLVESWRDRAGNYNQGSRTLRLTSDIIAHANVNLEDAAVLFAKQTMSMFDVIVAASKAKFQYSLLRPITYIRNVMGHTTWNPAATTPQLPSYPGYQGLQASSVAILENYFGNQYPVVDSTQAKLYGSWQYSSLDGWLHHVSRAAVNSGTEFRFAVETGMEQGIKLAKIYNALPFKKP